MNIIRIAELYQILVQSVYCTVWKFIQIYLFHIMHKIPLAIGRSNG